VPAWLVLFPVWVGTGLLFQIVLGVALVGLFSGLSNASSGSGIETWVFVMVYSGFAGQGAALAIAFTCHVRARWGHVLGERTGEVVARRTARVRSWPENHLAGTAEAVAGMAVAVALVFGYWAAGGSFGLSSSGPHPSLAMQTSGVAAAVTVVVGLLGLAGRWGNQARFWLPAALTWVGSGALAAFDGLTLVLNKLSFMLGTHLSEPGWSLTDTVLVIKVVIGVLAAAVGALSVTAAVKDNQEFSCEEAAMTSFSSSRSSVVICTTTHARPPMCQKVVCCRYEGPWIPSFQRDSPGGAAVGVFNQDVRRDRSNPVTAHRQTEPTVLEQPAEGGPR
jgi:hypothetical protein